MGVHGGLRLQASPLRKFAHGVIYYGAIYGVAGLTSFCAAVQLLFFLTDSKRGRVWVLLGRDI